MKVNGHEVMLNTATRLHGAMYISGWFQSKTDELVDVRLVSSENLIAQSGEVKSTAAKAFRSVNSRKEYSLQVLLKIPYVMTDNLVMSFQFASGSLQLVSLADLISERNNNHGSLKMYQDFTKEIRSQSDARVLEIGGRDRSEIDRSTEFPGVDYTVLDIVPSGNVDVVGDAHKLSQYFGPEEFDYVLSFSVFEHLAMPWKVAIEMNKVMKIGGQALLQAPQSCGMHDLPWDFWRFSETAWDALFNADTGFKVLHRMRDFENFILPFVIRSNTLEAEKTAGFEISQVIVQKISHTNLQWNVDPDDVIQGKYPTSEGATVPSLKSIVKSVVRRLLR
jgi:hypothetical protein